jgi:hypothetical protein
MAMSTAACPHTEDSEIFVKSGRIEENREKYLITFSYRKKLEEAKRRASVRRERAGGAGRRRYEGPTLCHAPRMPIFG